MKRATESEEQAPMKPGASQAGGAATKMDSVRQRPARALRLFEEPYRRIVETTHQAIWMADLQGVTTFVNGQMAQTLGYSPEEMIGRSVYDFVPGQQHAAVRRHFAEFLADPAGKKVEERLRRKDGTELWTVVEASVFRGEGGQPIGFLGMFTDVTERKRAEERLCQTQSELELEILAISEREQRRLGQDLHDDLCQQLAGIEFLSERLARQLARQGEPGVSQAREITRMVRNAMGQTRDLARGLFPVQLEAGGLSDALRSLAVRTKRIFHIACHFRSPDQVLLTDHAKAIHLYRIAQEAVGNAVKHAQARQVEISLGIEGNKLVLSVRDDGLGLPAKLSKRKGLGLAIMRHRAGVIGGSLRVERAARGGTAVICTVPDGWKCSAAGLDRKPRSKIKVHKRLDRIACIEESSYGRPRSWPLPPPIPNLDARSGADVEMRPHDTPAGDPRWPGAFEI